MPCRAVLCLPHDDPNFDTKVQVWSTAASVLVNGSFARLGLSPPASEMSTAPAFGLFQGTVAATHGGGGVVNSSNAGPVAVTVASAAGDAPALSQALQLNGYCLSQLGGGSAVMQPVSAEQCALMAACGFPASACARSTCPFVFAGELALTAAFGPGNDTFVGYAVPPNTAVNVDLGAGACNNFTWAFAGANSTAAVVSDGSRDTVRAVLPCGGHAVVTTNTPSNSRIMTVEVFAGDVAPLPSMGEDGIIAPLQNGGTAANDTYLQVHNLTEWDHVSITGGLPWNTTADAVSHVQRRRQKHRH